LRVVSRVLSRLRKKETPDGGTVDKLPHASMQAGIVQSQANIPQTEQIHLDF